MLKIILYYILAMGMVTGGTAEMTDKKKDKTISTYADDPEGIMAIISEHAKEMKETSLRYSLDGTVLPPWHVMPDVPMSSLAWRMGSGEYYRQMFFQFFLDLSSDERVKYITEYPEPEGWQNYYNLLIERSH